METRPIELTHLEVALVRDALLQDVSRTVDNKSEFMFAKVLDDLNDLVSMLEKLR